VPDKRTEKTKSPEMAEQPPSLSPKVTEGPAQLEKLQLKLGDSMHFFDASVAQKKKDVRERTKATIISLIGLLSSLVGSLLSFMDASRLGSLKKDVAWMAGLAFSSVLVIRLFLYILRVREPSKIARVKRDLIQAYSLVLKRSDLNPPSSP
jgi:hypothetical protein